ncbi:MAG: hypothetical protein KJ630_07705 [Proteobacteria bacterium]|nr:hypothetical protein [Pseudomonadota bacterium]
MKNSLYSLLKIFFLILASVAFLYNPVQAAEKKTRERLAVLDLEAKYGTDSIFAEGLSVIVRDAIHSYGEFQVMSQEDIRAVASREQLMQALGCENNSNECLVDFGRAIGTRFMVAGSISKFGKTYTISLRMLDTMGDSAGLVNRASEDCKCEEDGLIETARNVAASLIGKNAGVTNKVEADVKPLTKAGKKIEKERYRQDVEGNAHEGSQKAEKLPEDILPIADSLLFVNGTILDNKEGLEWLVGLDKDTSHYSAKEWIANLYNDQGEWRLPTLLELQTLYKNGLRVDQLETKLKISGWKVWSNENHHGPYGSNKYESVTCFDFKTGGSLQIAVESSWTGRDPIWDVRAFAVRPKKSR